MKHTIWTKVSGSEHYLVSIDGTVISMARVTNLGRYGKRTEKQKFLSLTTRRTGYISVALGKGKQGSVHRMVAIGFLPSVQNKDSVLHKDDVKNNNTLENLYWGDALDNARDALRNGYKPKISYSCLAKSVSSRRTPVIAYNDNEELKFNSKTELANHFGVVASAVSNALSGGRTIGSKSNGFGGTHHVRLA